MFNKHLILISALAILSASGFADTTGPLDLQEVCRMAAQTNPALAGARANVELSAAAAKKARGVMRPSVSVSSGYQYVSKETVFGSTPILEQNTVVNRVELMQPIFTGGAQQAAARSAEQGLYAARSNQSVVKSQVVTGAAAAYFRAKQAREAIKVAESSIKYLESSYDAARKMHVEGVVTNSDVLRSEVALTTAKDRLIRSQNDYATALAALKTAIGLPQSAAIELSTDSPDAALRGIDALPARRRPEVEAAEYSVKAVGEQLRAARAARQPQVGLVADFQNQPTGAEFPRLSNTFGIGVVARINILDGGQIKAGEHEAQASVDRARADLMSVTQSTEFQLESARLTANSARERVNALATQVKSAEDSLRVVQAGYTEGINVMTDVLSVESMVTAAKVSVLAAEYDLKIAELNLLLALGQTDILNRVQDDRIGGIL